MGITYRGIFLQARPKASATIIVTLRLLPTLSIKMRNTFSAKYVHFTISDWHDLEKKGSRYDGVTYRYLGLRTEN